VSGRDFLPTHNPGSSRGGIRPGGLAGLCGRTSAPLRHLINLRPIWLRLALHVFVRFSLNHALKTQTPIQLDRSNVLQPSSENHLLPLRMRLRECVSKYLCSDTAALVFRLNLNLTYFDGIGMFEQLNHAHTSIIDFDRTNLAAF